MIKKFHIVESEIGTIIICPPQITPQVKNSRIVSEVTLLPKNEWLPSIRYEFLYENSSLIYFAWENNFSFVSSSDFLQPFESTRPISFEGKDWASFLETHRIVCETMKWIGRFL